MSESSDFYSVGRYILAEVLNFYSGGRVKGRALVGVGNAHGLTLDPKGTFSLVNLRLWGDIFKSY